MSTEKKFEKIAKYLSDNMVSEEREDFFAWVEEDAANKELLDDSMEIWEYAEDTADTFEVNMEEAWAGVDQRLEQKRYVQEANQTLEVVSYIRPLLRVAAAVILLLMAGIWYKDYQSTPDVAIVATQPTENTIVELPDGSEVWLNEMSQLTYEKKFEKRVVNLIGEAFFKVAKKDGASFEIHAGDSKTTVLGTEFNLRAYPEEDFVEVVVEEGKVLFESKQQKESKVILTEKEYAVYTNTSEVVQKEAGTQPNASAWKKKELDFGEATMEQAVPALERYFNIDIEVENQNILKCNWGYTMNKLPDPNLETIFEQINFGTNYSFKPIGEKKYLLSGKGCE